MLNLRNSSYESEIVMIVVSRDSKFLSGTTN